MPVLTFSPVPLTEVPAMRWVARTATRRPSVMPQVCYCVDRRRRGSGRRTERHGRSVGTFNGMFLRYTMVLQRPAIRPGVAGPLPCPPPR
jgi:hypothetical protein